MVRCWSCSEPRDDSDLFCKQCGAPADKPVVEPVLPETEEVEVEEEDNG